MDAGFEDCERRARHWMTYRPPVDAQPGAKVQRYDSSGGGGAPDGAMEPVCRDVDLEAAAASLEPCLAAVAAFWHGTPLFEGLEEFDRRDRRKRQGAFARQLAQYAAAADPASWPLLEEVAALQQPRDDGGRFAGRISDLSWWQLACALRLRAARGMAERLGAGW